MVKKLKLRPKKIMSENKAKNASKNIKRTYISPEKRDNKIRNDRIKIAKRYEEMRLYDEAIKYYKKLKMIDDVKRVSKIKKGIYLTKANEFEAGGKYEDAARLYENLKMTEDLERVRKLMGDDDDDDLEDSDGKGAEPSDDAEEDIEVEGIVSEFDYDEEAVEPVTESVDSVTKENIESEESEPVNENVPGNNKALETARSEGPKKIFKICPYCGEELNLPKKPNFCPYCEESFV